MDVNQVLEGTLSADASTRQSAEQQLLHAAEVDFAGYLTTLANELANENAQAHIRTAAGIALKNAFSFRETAKLREVQTRWVQQIDIQVKNSVKELALKTLSSSDSRAGQSAAQFIVSIAAIEIPRNEWPELMNTLVQNVGSGSDSLKQASLTTIGFICESEEPELRENLSTHSNAILTAVVQGARREEPNADVRNAALSALGDAIEFVRSNFENEGERNYIMQVICEATQSEDTRIQAGAFGCLNRIMALYYDKMRFYMEKALFGLTIMGMKNEEEDVAKLAIEFWCTVCEEEINIEDDNAAAQAEGSTEIRPFFSFSRIACREVVPVLLELLTTQDEDAADDDYNVSRAAYQALQLYSQCVAGDIIQPVLGFVEGNLRNEDWHRRDAAVSAFGAIMDGPDLKTLDPLIKQALPVIIAMMDDKEVHVKDSTAYALGRICDYCSESIHPDVHLQPLISCLFNGLASSPKMAGSCCWSLMNLADRFAGDPGADTNPLSKHFQDSIGSLLTVTERTDADNHLRTAAYEVLNSFVTNAANDSLPIVGNLSDVILQRLEQTVPMQQQVVSVEDRITLEEMQTSLTSVLLAVVQRLEAEVKPQADRIMHVLLQVLNTVPPKSSVPDTVFATVGSLASALEEEFVKYMESFSPFLYNALGNQEEPGLCAMAIGLVSDITRSLGDKVQPFCDTFMNYLLNNLRSTTLSNQLKPSILETFGDIAQAIGVHFETYLSVVAQVLQQASGVTASPDVSFDMLDYIVSLREGIMDAWGGILQAYKGTPNAEGLQPYVESIFHLLNIVAHDTNRSEGLLRAAMGVIGDLADAFPNGEFANLFRNDWLSELIRQTKTTREFSPRTIDTARWAREQTKRQINLAASVTMS
ncbi:karyopherin beta [Arachnomyces sp. PD_36]|nr:karyopherin beta [Arachnomyces sp. PD_36]